MMRLILGMGMALGLLLNTACGTCIGQSAGTCDSPAVGPNEVAQAVSRECITEPCTAEGDLLIQSDQVVLIYTDELGVEWVTSWDR